MTASRRGDVAIVGMAALFPGAPDLSSYWRNICAGVDAITDVPPARWDPVFYDPQATTSDRFYCRRGGFVDALASFDALRFGVMPVQVAASEPDQLLALQVAAQALTDAGLDDRPFARERTAVILGRGNYAGAGRTRMEQHVRAAEQLVQSLRALVPGVGEAELQAVKAEFQGQLHAAGPDSAIGLVPNLTASRIANRLDLQGPAYTVDAACASSLIAVDHAISELSSGRCDVALAGGVHLCHDEAFWSVFCQLGALSRREQIRPFDRRADGILIGEGIGVVVLKRRADAEADGDRIYAVIRGAGVGSDGREASLMTPRVEGQLLALRRAWEEAGLPPESVGLVEAHGTGTPAGDAAELSTLQRFFGVAGPGEARAALGSVKSMIGHAMPAAGIAGLIKAALTVHHGLLPPTLHCEEPREELLATRFALATRLAPWERRGGPRVAAVNAFGFGGINAHVVLSEHAAPQRGPGSGARRPLEDADEQLLRLAAATPAGLLAALHRGEEGGSGPARLALLDPTPARRARARAVVEKGRAWPGREGIWFSPRGLLQDGGKLAFLFPGVDSSFEPHVEDLARHLGLPAPPPARGGLEEVGVAIVAVNRLLHRALGELGLRADLMAGHSIGEWSGMIAAGVLPEEAVDAFVAQLRPGSLRVPGVVFAAAGCGVAQAEAAMEGLLELGLSHDNCPHQVILCGNEESVDAALGRLRAGGVLCQKLPFQSGFHSPLFAPFLGPHRENFAELPLRPASTPLFSATTCGPYPEDESSLRALALEHLVRPVRFRELVEELHLRGARVFVQVGTGSLVGFVEDTLRGKPHLAWSANVPQRSGLAQLRRLAAALFVEGAEVAFDKLAPARPLATARPVKLALGVPLVKLTRPLSVTARDTARTELPGGALAAELQLALDDVAAAQLEVVRFLSRRPSSPGRLGPRQATTRRVLSVESFPALLDHCFFRQPAGWPSVADRHPVVPMTTLVGMMLDAAAALVPERLPVGLADVQASRWLAVGTPVAAQLHARFDGESSVRVQVEGYAEGTVLLSEAYPAAPAASEAKLPGEEPPPFAAAALYEDRWMFHGPAFRGVTELTGVSPDGIRGTLTAGEAQGALLDNAGQLFGLLVMLRADRDRMAMPVRLGQVRLYGPHPPPGAQVQCSVRLTRFEAKDVVADLTLDHDGQRWCEIDGWVDRRFETDDRLWPVMLFPERSVLAEPLATGLVTFHDRYRSAPARDQLARRFLGEAERAALEALVPKRQRPWLNERIAAKDAVRSLLGVGPGRGIFPVEVALTGDGGSLRATAPGAHELRVAVASGEDLAVALAVEGREPGVAVARLGATARELAEATFTPEELRLLGEGDRDEGICRLVAAKDAVARARGVAPQGAWRLRATDRTGERLLVDDLWVETRRDGTHVLAWTTT